MISVKDGQLEISGSRVEIVGELIVLVQGLAKGDILGFKAIRATVDCAENKSEDSMFAILAALAEQAGRSYEKTHAEGFENFRQMMDSIFRRNKAN